MNKQQQSTGVGFGGLLTLVFITLKLCGVIAWSWWWVLCPAWIPLAIILAFCAFCALMGLIVHILSKSVD